MIPCRKARLKDQIQNKLGLKPDDILDRIDKGKLKDQIQNKLGLKPVKLIATLINHLLKDQIQNKLGLKLRDVARDYFHGIA